MAVAERMRASVKQRKLPNPGGIDGIVTISVGVAQRQTSGSVEELMNAADGALYKAKQAGRDRVAD
jgi:diguanylate cyclase (GGDEF)-like protein